MISRSASANRSPSDSIFALFSVLWGAATLFHIASYGQWGTARWVVVAALWLLLRPGSVVAFSALAMLQLAKTWTTTPFIPNHWLFEAFLNLAWLGSVALAFAGRRDRIPSGGAVLDISAPAVRISLLLLYFLVVWHKLNADWFDPAVSCGTMFYGALLHRMPFLPHSSAIDIAAIALGIGFEALIPLLLLFRRTRHAGVLVGAGFHWFLALNPIDRFYNFSSLLLALFALFAAPALLTDALERFGRRRLVVTSWTLAVILIGCALLGRSTFTRDALGGIDPFLLVWTVYGAAYLAIAATLLHRRRRVATEFGRPFHLLKPVLVLLPVLVFLNGITPYLGLKTEIAWAMFSNLRTEGDVTNHWIVPAGIQPFDFQRDLVLVTASSDRFLQSLARTNEHIPYFELKRRPEASVTYVRDGVTHSFDRIADDPHYGAPLSTLLEKFMMFRPLDPDAARACTH